jgi:hypothetical protein
MKSSKLAVAFESLLSAVPLDVSRVSKYCSLPDFIESATTSYNDLI